MVEKEERKKAFLAALRGDSTGMPLSIRAACDEIGISRTAFRHWREADPAFREAFEDAYDDGSDLMEDEATRRAVKGVKQDVYHAGDVVGEKTVYSDDLMKFMLAGRRPERYRDGVTINNMNAQVAGPVDDAQIARALSLILAQAKQKQLGG